MGFLSWASWREAEMRLMTHDGVVLEAETAEGIIEQMRAQAHRASGVTESLDDFMAEMAFRAGEWNGTEVDTGSPQRFVDTLIAGGLLLRPS